MIKLSKLPAFALSLQNTIYKKRWQVLYMVDKRTQHVGQHSANMLAHVGQHVAMV